MTATLQSGRRQGLTRKMSFRPTSPSYSPTTPTYSPSSPREASFTLQRSESSSYPALSLLSERTHHQKRPREDDDEVQPARRRKHGKCTNDDLHNVRKTRDETRYDLAQAELAVERLKTCVARLYEREAAVLEEQVDDLLNKIDYIWDRYGAAPSNAASVRFIPNLSVPELEDHIKLLDKAYREVSVYHDYTPLTGCSCFNDK